MRKLRSSRLTVAVVAAVAAVLIAGGGAVASNMGFKLNKPIQFQPSPTVPGIGDNWTSLPYFNPYSGGTCTTAAGVPCIDQLCVQTGLRGGLLRPATVTTIDATNNIPATANCGTATAKSVALPSDGRGVLIRQNACTSGSCASTASNIIIVGSHDPAKTLNVLQFCQTRAASPAYCAAVPTTGQGEFWMSVPYHTTAVSFKDLCNSSNLSRTITSTATLTRIEASTGVPQSSTCFATGATGITLRLGEAVRIREVAVKSFVPAHF